MSFNEISNFLLIFGRYSIRTLLVYETHLIQLTELTRTLQGSVLKNCSAYHKPSNDA